MGVYKWYHISQIVTYVCPKIPENVFHGYKHIYVGKEDKIWIINVSFKITFLQKEEPTFHLPECISCTFICYELAKTILLNSNENSYK